MGDLSENLLPIRLHSHSEERILVDFVGANILSIDAFERDDIESLFSVARRMEPYAQRRRGTTALKGAILGNMFFEASTRTRVSFGCAFNLLGGEVRETTGIESSALSKENHYKILREF